MVLAIYGSGGLGREVLELAKQINALEGRWTDVIFFDDATSASAAGRVRVITFNEAVVQYATDRVVLCIAVGEPSVRAQLFERIRKAGYTSATLVHPKVHISEETSIGPGTIICEGCFVSCDVKLGENILLQPNASVGHDCQVGSHSVISTSVSLGGHCVVGARTFIGMNVPVKEGTTIGDDVIVGMGSVVLRNIDSGVVALGNPARPMSLNHSKRVFRT